MENILSKHSENYGAIEGNSRAIVKATEALAAMKEYAKIQSIEFLKWLKENDTPERAEEWFHYSDEDMYEAFLNTKTNK